MKPSENTEQCGNVGPGGVRCEGERGHPGLCFALVSTQAVAIEPPPTLGVCVAEAVTVREKIG